MNPAEHQHSAFFQRAQSGWNQLAGRRENNRCVEFFRGSVSGLTGPHRSQLCLAVDDFFRARSAYNFGAPVSHHLNGYVRCRSKSIECQSLPAPRTFLNAGKLRQRNPIMPAHNSGAACWS